MTNHRKHQRVMGIAPVSRGFGYAILDGDDTLVDWGLKIIEQDKNARVVAHVSKFMTRYAPNVLLLQDYWAEDSSRGERIKQLGGELIKLAHREGIGTKLLTRQRVYAAFLGRRKGNKYEIAKLLAARFPEELAYSLPVNRLFWKSEDARIAVFEAVALAAAWLRIPRKQLS